MSDPAPLEARTKRLTLSEVVERLLARGAGDRTSVALTRNAKGETQIEVVVRTTEDGEITTADAAADKALELYERLAARYPLASGLAHAAPLGEVPA